MAVTWTAGKAVLFESMGKRDMHASFESVASMSMKWRAVCWCRKRRKPANSFVVPVALELK